MAHPDRHLAPARDSLCEQLIINRSRPSRRWSRRLRDNVLAVELSRKLTGGRDTGQWCLRVVVRRKTRRPPAALADRLPRSWRGVPVDVVQGGDRVTPLAHCYPNVHRRLERPPGIIGGVSLGPLQPRNVLGTAAAVVRRSGRTGNYLLTCRHVVQPPGAAPGAVIQPGGAKRRPRRVGRVVDVFPLNFDGSTNIADAALVELDEGIAATFRMVNCLGHVTATLTDRDALLERVGHNQIVRTAGASTARPTWGTLAAVESGVRVSYNGGREAFFDHQIAIRPGQPDPLTPPQLADRGDSGALVVCPGHHEELMAVGLLFAATEGFAYAAPIGPIMEHFGIRFG